MAMHAALLRGVSATLVKNAELVRAFEAAGFREVRTVLSSGNVIFEARRSANIEGRIEAAMRTELGRVFAPIVRSIDELRALIAADPFARLPVPAGAKRVVSFFREKRKPAIRLPVSREGATIHAVRGREAFTSYLRGPSTPVFMTLIEEAFGKSVTTRTWDTLLKIIAAVH